MKRKPKFVLPTKYILLILSGVCIVAILLSFTLGISGGPLNTVAGYVFIPMQRGINSVGSWIGEKADNLKKLNDVMAENEDLKRQVDDLTTELNTIKLEQYELDNLRELLKLDQKYPSYDKVAANVIEFSNLNDKDNKVAIGDPVVTSYVSNRYQQGILIGYISTLTMDSNNLTKSGTITPAVDFEHIEEVLVILNKKQTAES